MTKYIQLNDTVAQVLTGMSGLLFDIPADKRVANGPIKQGFLERQEKQDDGSYKTRARLEVAGFAAEGNGKKYVRLVIAGGMATGAIFKLDEPKDDLVAGGNVGPQGTTLRVAVRKTNKDGQQRISVYEDTRQQGGGEGASQSSAPGSGGGDMDDDIPLAPMARGSSLHCI